MNTRITINQKEKIKEININEIDNFYVVMRINDNKRISPILYSFMEANIYMDNEGLNDNDYGIYEIEDHIPKSLNFNGFVNVNYNNKIDYVNKFSIDELRPIIKFIENNTNKTSSFNYRRSSYNLKHIFERSIKTKHLITKTNTISENYIPNGVLIAAMILCGFRFKKITKTPNCYFNISEKSIKLIKNKLKELETN